MFWVQDPGTPRCCIGRGSCGGGSTLGAGAALGVWKLFRGSSGDVTAGTGQDGQAGAKPDVQKYHPSMGMNWSSWQDLGAWPGGHHPSPLSLSPCQAACCIKHFPQQLIGPWWALHGVSPGVSWGCLVAAPRAVAQLHPTRIPPSLPSPGQEAWAEGVGLWAGVQGAPGATAWPSRLCFGKPSQEGSER